MEFESLHESKRSRAAWNLSVGQIIFEAQLVISALIISREKKLIMSSILFKASLQESPEKNFLHLSKTRSPLGPVYTEIREFPLNYVAPRVKLIRGSSCSIEHVDVACCSHLSGKVICCWVVLLLLVWGLGEISESQITTRGTEMEVSCILVLNLFGSVPLSLQISIGASCDVGLSVQVFGLENL